MESDVLGLGVPFVLMLGVGAGDRLLVSVGEEVAEGQ